MTWRRGALILSVYLVLAAALTGAVLHVTTGGRAVSADLVPEPEQRAAVEIRAGVPGADGPAGREEVGGRAGVVTPGSGRDVESLSAGLSRRAAEGPVSSPPRSAPRMPSVPTPAGGTPRPGPGPAPVPSPDPPAPAPVPAPTPVSGPTAAAPPTTTLRSVEGTGSTGSTQQLLLDFAVDEPAVPGSPAERSVRLPMSVTPPDDAAALRFDVLLDLSEDATARVSVAPVRDAPARPTVARGETGTHSIVIPLPLNGVLAPAAAAAGPFTAPPATIAVPFAPR
jgi:hypothetical protein